MCWHATASAHLPCLSLAEGGFLGDADDKNQDDTSSENAIGTRSSTLIPPRTQNFPTRTQRVTKLATRALLLELPVLLIFVVCAAVQTLDYVNRNYLTKQLEAMVFTEARQEAEITYYKRPCMADDLTTRNGSDLFLSPDATPEDVYEHHLLHGFSVFRNTLRPETMTKLRNYIIARNHELSVGEAFDVLESANRSSFGLRTDNPIVMEAVKELTNHPQVRPSLEKILGPDPALIEMTSITARFGAAAQHFHEDVRADAAAKWYARTFIPAFSLFVPLQNTTAAMGATGACPGSQYCSSDDCDVLWEGVGFPLVDPNVGHWPGGDALLMTQSAFHRGAAHTDPDGPDRVLFILTFAPKWTPRNGARLLGLGSTYSLNWDEWGHTLNDLRTDDTRMKKHPWKALKALGLYKPKTAAWGIDYITSSSMRIVNGDVAYAWWKFHEHMASGGFKWLPQFLEGEPLNEDEPWLEYYQDTLRRCFVFCSALRVYAAMAYLTFSLGIAMFWNSSTLIALVRGAVKLGLVWLAAFYLHQGLQQKVDGSTWAKNIASGTLYSNIFENQASIGFGVLGATTLPTRLDVLIETRFGSEYLGLVNDFIDGHPANRNFRSQVQATANQYVLYPASFRNATSHFILNSIQHNGGRFLFQGPLGNWHTIEEADAIRHISRELVTRTDPLSAALMKRSRHILSDYMYGPFRRTVLAQKHAIPYQRMLESAILNLGPYVDTRSAARSPTKRNDLFDPCRSLPDLRLPTAKTSSRSPLPPFVAAVEASDGDWMASGVAVETWYRGLWRYGHLDEVSATGFYSIWVPAMEETVYASRRSVRRATELRPGEKLQYTDELLESHHCYVAGVNVDGTYNIHLDYLNAHVDGVPRDLLARRDDTEHHAA